MTAIVYELLQYNTHVRDECNTRISLRQAYLNSCATDISD